MAEIPFSPQQRVGVGTPRNPRASVAAAQAPFQAIAGAGQAIGQIADRMSALKEQENAQIDSLQASKYENSYVAQKSEIANFKLKQEEAGALATPEEIAEINERYSLTREGYISEMSEGKQVRYNSDHEFKLQVIDQGTENFFVQQNIETRSAEFQVNYNELLRAGNFDEAGALVEEAEWMTPKQKVEMEEQGRRSVHASQWKGEIAYSDTIRRSFDDREIGWQQAEDQLDARTQAVVDSGDFSQDEQAKIAMRNSNAGNSIRRQAQTEVNTIMGIAIAQAKQGNSIQGIIDEQGEFISSVYPARAKALESFENSRTMVEFQADAVLKEEATETALWRLNNNREDLAERVKKQTGYWINKFFDPEGAEDVDSLIDDILSSDEIPKEDKGLLAEILVNASEDRVSGQGGGMLQHKKISEGYTSLVDGYAQASAQAGNPNYWNTFFDDVAQVQEYAKEHSIDETKTFVKERVTALADRSNAEVLQVILGVKASGRKAEQTFGKATVVDEARDASGKVIARRYSDGTIEKVK